MRRGCKGARVAACSRVGCIRCGSLGGAHRRCCVRALVGSPRLRRAPALASGRLHALTGAPWKAARVSRWFSCAARACRSRFDGVRRVLALAGPASAADALPRGAPQDKAHKARRREVRQPEAAHSKRFSSPQKCATSTTHHVAHACGTTLSGQSRDAASARPAPGGTSRLAARFRRSRQTARASPAAPAAPPAKHGRFHLLFASYCALRAPCVWPDAASSWRASAELLSARTRGTSRCGGLAAAAVREPLRDGSLVATPQLAWSRRRP